MLTHPRSRVCSGFASEFGRATTVIIALNLYNDLIWLSIVVNKDHEVMIERSIVRIVRSHPLHVHQSVRTKAGLSGTHTRCWYD